MYKTKQNRSSYSDSIRAKRFSGRRGMDFKGVLLFRVIENWLWCSRCGVGEGCNLTCCSSATAHRISAAATGRTDVLLLQQQQQQQQLLLLAIVVVVIVRAATSSSSSRAWYQSRVSRQFRLVVGGCLQ